MADWDSFAASYDDIFLENPIYVRAIRMMLELAGEGSDRSFLDLGCGTGNVTAALIEQFPAAEVLAVDPSQGMRETSARRFDGVEGVKVAAGDALSIPSRDGEFDCALSNIALHHVPPGQRGACASELARVLKPGGDLIYCDFFSNVDGGPDDPGWCRNVIETHVAYALDCLENGAYEMMLLMFKSLPMTLRQDGEFLACAQVWIEALEPAGFGDFEIFDVPPAGTGTHIIFGVRS